MSELNKNIRLYLAVRKREDRSHLEDTLVLDGFNVGALGSASEAWSCFQEHPARMVITDLEFEEGMSGLELARNIRQKFLLPYVYIVARSVMNHIPEIEEGLAAGVDDYLIMPHNPFQLRSRILVGLRWLKYIDSINPGRKETVT